jgi:hypothetical protein
MTLRETILHANDRQREAVDVSEFWPEVGTVYVSVMTGSDRDSWEWSYDDARKAKSDLVSLYLVRCITDETGARIFNDDDVSALGAKNWKALDRLWDAARRLNKMSQAEQEAIEKNSATPVGNAS